LNLVGIAEITRNQIEEYIWRWYPVLEAGHELGLE